MFSVIPGGNFIKTKQIPKNMSWGAIIYGRSWGEVTHYEAVLTADSTIYEDLIKNLESKGCFIINSQKNIDINKLSEIRQKMDLLVIKLREQGQEGLEQEIEEVFH